MRSTILTAILSACFVALVSADVLFSNITAAFPGDFNSAAGTRQDFADPFVATASGEVSDVRFTVAGASSKSISVGLYTGSSGPAALLGSWTFTSPGPTPLPRSP
jgi:hypothetical protein